MKIHLSLYSFFIVCFSLLLVAGNANAVTYNWTGGAADGGKWTTPGNWSVGVGYPGTLAADIAQFTNAGTFTVKLTSAITLANIKETSGTTLLTINTAGFALTVNTGIALGSNSSTLTFLGSGAVSIAAMTFQNGDILTCGSASDATTKVTFTGTIITLANNSGNGIFNYGTFNLTTSQLYTGSSSQINNESGGTFNATSSLIYLQNGSSSIVNSGNFNLIASSAYLNVNPCSITNNPSGVFSMNASLLSFSTGNNEEFYNYGTVNATTGSNTISMLSGSSDNTIYNYGTFNAGSGASACSITLAGTRGDIKNTSAVLSGTTYNGSFNLGSTSIINFNAACSNCQVDNDVTCASCVFTLFSDANGSATIYQIPSGSSCPGTFKAQRFVTGGNTYTSGRWIYRNYRLLSSPVNEGVDGGGNYPYSLNYIAANTIVTACTSTFGTTTGNPSLYLYNETYTPSNATYTSGNFIGVTDISSIVPGGHITTTDATNTTAKIYVGAGYMMFFRGDKITNIAGTPSKTKYPYVAPENVTFSTSGDLNQGTYSVKSWTGYSGLLYTTSNAGNAAVRGFNLVGNPYPSSIDWSTFSSSTSTAPIYGAFVNPTIYILNPTTNNFDTYNATTNGFTGSASKVIPSGQGFFVQSNNHLSSLTFNENAKTSSQVTGGSLLLGTPIAQNAYNRYLRLKLVTDPVNYDDMVIGFNATSTTKYNANEDSEYLPGFGAPESISATTSDSVQTTIKWLPLPKTALSQVIKLNVSAKASGAYTLERTDFKEIPVIYEVWLIDSYKKDSLDIRNNSTYVFNIDLTDTNSYGKNRFQVVVRQNPALSLHLLNFAAAKAPGGAQMVWKTENEQNYTNFTVERSTDSGATFNVLGGFASSALGTYSFLDKAPPVSADLYRLKLEDLNGTISYSNAVTLMYSNLSDNIAGNISVYPNPASNTINLAINQNNSSPATLSSIQKAVSTHGLIQTSGNQSYGIKIINITGSVMKTGTSLQTNWQDNIEKLLPGTYIIQVLNNSDNTVVGKSTFIKL